MKPERKQDKQEDLYWAAAGRAAHGGPGVP